MATKTEKKEVLKIANGILRKEIFSVKTSTAEYQAEREANWKVFKAKTDTQRKNMSKSFDRLSIFKKK